MRTSRVSTLRSRCFARAILLVLPLLLGACFLLPKRTVIKEVPVERVVEVPVLHEVVKPCLTEPMPELPPVAAPTACVPGYFCFTFDAGSLLLDNVTVLKDRVRDDWIRCGPPTAGVGSGS